MLADIINVVQTSMLVTGHLNHLYISLISSNSPLMHPVTEPPPHRGLDFVVANPLVVGIADHTPPPGGGGDMGGHVLRETTSRGWDP
jgi:hypothetical protein